MINSGALWEEFDSDFGLSPASVLVIRVLRFHFTSLHFTCRLSLHTLAKTDT